MELLAPIARLLDISLDTLLAFHEKLSDAEIQEIIRKMDRMFSEEGYEKTYEWVESCLCGIASKFSGGGIIILMKKFTKVTAI